MKLLVVILFLSVSLAHGYKILGVFPFGSKSHYAIGEATMRSLAEAGHEVTMVSVFEQKKPLPNFKQIKITDFYETVLKDQAGFNPFEFAQMNLLVNFAFMFKMGKDQAEHFLTDDAVKNLLNSDEKFDAVIVELFVIDSLVGLGEHFNCPIIGVTTFDGTYWNDVYTANQSPYSYVPNLFLGLPDKMNFWERVQNTVFSDIEKFVYTYYNLRNHRKLYEKYFPKATKSFDEAHKSLSVVFMNSHVSSSTARPLQPNMIGINGIHVEPAKPLPEDIKKFLDSATDGAILFSMGSFVQSTDWSVQQREAFVKAFGKLKQKVLWKYENETLPGNPGNIMIGSWIPQRDIVAHPNVKLFITHGGSLGTTEALSEGVPLLGIPLFGDQQMNMKRAVAKGYALTLDFRTLDEENFSETLNELLTNPKYDRNAKRLSKIFKDRPLDPKQTVVYWTEHVIRQEGASYLQVQAHSLSYIEFHSIDVYAFLFAAFLMLFYIFYKIIKHFIKKLFKKSTPTKQKKQ